MQLAGPAAAQLPRRPRPGQPVLLHKRKPRGRAPAPSSLPLPTLPPAPPRLAASERPSLETLAALSAEARATPVACRLRRRIDGVMAQTGAPLVPFFFTFFFLLYQVDNYSQQVQSFVLISIVDV